MAKGMTIVMALSCAAKLRAGQKCSMRETAAALDTLAWAYKKGQQARKKNQAFIKKDLKKRGRSAKRTYNRTR